MSQSKKLIPKRRFKQFSSNWNLTTLGKIAEIVRGASPRPIQDQKWFDKNSDIGWLRISDVTEQEGRIYYLEQRLSLAGQEKTRVLYEPHLLLSIAATVGKPVINYIKTGVHDGFLIFLNPKFHREFLFQYLDMFKLQWQKYGQPGSQVNLNSDIVKNHNIELPNSDEQTQIGEFFKKLDNFISTQQKKLEKAKTLKSAYLREMFPDDGKSKPKLRFSGNDNYWQCLSLGDLTNIKTGDSDAQDSVINGVYPFFVRSENIERSNRYLYDGEAILVPGEGRLGEIFHYIKGKFDYHQRVYKISDFRENINGKFVFYYMQKTFKKHALKYTVKATVDSLRLPMLTDYLLLCPSLKEQNNISSLFEKLDNKIALEQKKLDKLKNIKQAYLNEMFV
jgi:type I restriction enzyme, S subunit